jgi:hypothetical protein
MGLEMFSEEDRRFMTSLGIDERRVLEQLILFERGARFARLDRPCTLGDGILQVPAERRPHYEALHAEAASAGRFSWFVPASGAATRMFQALFKVFKESPPPSRDAMERRARQGDRDAAAFLEFVENAHRFAFYDDWKNVMARCGLDLGSEPAAGRYATALEFLLTERGLHYGYLPKALLKFHAYPDGARTAFEEHLVDAVSIVKDGHGVCRLHFTVSPEHEALLREHARVAAASYGRKYGAVFEITFSHQSPGTQTLAVDRDNQPVRDAGGRLVFRPSGHGALLGNLNDLQADVVFIKNIDNVVPDHLKGATIAWKKVLAGVLLNIQQRAHGFVRALKSDRYAAVLEDAAAFVNETFLCEAPVGGTSRKALRDGLLDRLDRPLRVCGMVKNVGAPGGGPFWVQGDDRRLSRQIVEKAQVDWSDESQRAVWEKASHFNPVDLVCAVRDAAGRPYDLMRYRDPQAVLITVKSMEGREVKALELPGLWNGSMAYWNTIFVEVPLETFNPVKTVNDLLRPEHQPG